VRTGSTGELEARLLIPAYGGPDLSALPPRPPLPSVAAPGQTQPPEIVTQVPSTEAAPDVRDDSVPQTPRRRSTAELPIPPVDADPRVDETSGDPYTGTLPVVGGAPAPGPRRALRAEPPDDFDDEHLLETHNAPAAYASAYAPGATPPDPWAPPFDVLPPVRTPQYSPGPGEGGFSETSAEVSAVLGTPALGEPMSARSSVSSLRGEPELPDGDSAFDETIIGSRRRTAWMLTPPLGNPIAVTSDVLIVGRRPSSDPQFSHAQLVPVADETRTMSKTHARLELDGDGWLITDLDSTNGVVLLRADGSEVELAPRQPEIVTETFLLGDAELRLSRTLGAG
jgi:hypothetical protein